MIFIDSDKQNSECKTVNIFLPISLKVCFGCFKFFENPHLLWLRIRKFNFFVMGLDLAVLTDLHCSHINVQTKNKTHQAHWVAVQTHLPFLF